MRTTTFDNSVASPARSTPFAIKNLLKWGALSLVSLALLYIVWGLYLAGEPLFGVVVLALMVGIVTIFSQKKFYTIRFVFPAIAAIGLFIVLPVLYTSYIGFTNFGARNLLSFERVTNQFLGAVSLDKSTERPFQILPDTNGYKIILIEENTALISEPTPLDGTPAKLLMSVAPLPETSALAMRETIKLRAALAQITLILPDRTELKPSSLRTFAAQQPQYQLQPDGTLLNTIDATTLTPDQSQGFYIDESGETVSPGWRVNVGVDNFKRILFSDGIREPMVQIFIWTVVFATLSMVFTFSLGLLLASILQWPHLRFRGFYRIMLILPYAVPAFISILVFRGLFNQNFGEINLILEALFGIKPQWFTDATLTRSLTLIVNTWLGYPYMMLLGMGYLQSVPQDHYKAAALEGAGPIRSFFSITLPHILPPFVPLLIANFAFNFNNVVLILLLTRGLPDIIGTQIPAGQTDILGSFTYRMSFSDSGQNFGMAGAISTLIFIIVAIIAYVNFRAMRAYAQKKGVAQ